MKYLLIALIILAGCDKLSNNPVQEYSKEHTVTCEFDTWTDCRDYKYVSGVQYPPQCLSEKWICSDGKVIITPEDKS